MICARQGMDRTQLIKCFYILHPQISAFIIGRKKKCVFFPVSKCMKNVVCAGGWSACCVNASRGHARYTVHILHMFRTLKWANASTITRVRVHVYNYSCSTTLMSYPADINDRYSASASEDDPRRLTARPGARCSSHTAEISQQSRRACRHVRWM